MIAGGLGIVGLTMPGATHGANSAGSASRGNLSKKSSRASEGGRRHGTTRGAGLGGMSIQSKAWIKMATARTTFDAKC